MQGWYLVSIPAKQILPITESELYIIDPIDGGCGCDCNCGSGSGSGGNSGGGGLYPEPGIDLYDEVDRAFIVVETIQDRNALSSRMLPHGKVVKVNNGDNPKYYYWDANQNQWLEETFGIDLTPYLTREDARKYFLKKEDAEKQYVKESTLDDKLDELEKSTEKKIDDKVTGLRSELSLKDMQLENQIKDKATEMAQQFDDKLEKAQEQCKQNLEQVKEEAAQAAKESAETAAEQVIQEHVEAGDFLTEEAGDSRYLKKDEAIIDTFDFIDGGLAKEFTPEMMKRRVLAWASLASAS